MPVRAVKRKICLIVLSVVSMCFISGCATTFNEQHYFQTVKESSDGRRIPTNYYRLDVRGHSLFSSARYVSGYYDERAVDLFFDEIKMKPTSTADGATPDSRKLFTQAIPAPSTGVEKIEPLSPNAKHGAFVMILSTNASAVTNAIGQFAENQIMAEAITNLANRNLISQQAGGVDSPQFREKQAAAIASEIKGLVTLVPFSDPAPDLSNTKRTLLRVLSSIARAKGSNESFQTLKEASTWFSVND